MFLPEVNSQSGNNCTMLMLTVLGSEIHNQNSVNVPVLFGFVIFGVCFGIVRFATVSNLKAVCCAFDVYLYIVFIWYTWYRAFTLAVLYILDQKRQPSSGRAIPRKLVASSWRSGLSYNSLECV